MVAQILSIRMEKGGGEDSWVEKNGKYSAYLREL